MDKIFEKFSLYDLLGVYLPGAMFVANMEIIAYICLNSSSHCHSQICEKYIIAFCNAIGKCPNAVLYTLFAYLFGVIIHEAGRFLSDLLNLFKTSVISDLILNPDKRKNHVKLIRSMAEEANVCLESNIRHKEMLVNFVFEKALNHNRYGLKKVANRASKYHSLYGVARGLALDMLFGLFCVSLMFPLGKITHGLCFVLFLIYGLFFILLLFRTYRYCISWVKNIYLQYIYDNGWQN